MTSSIADYWQVPCAEQLRDVMSWASGNVCDELAVQKTKNNVEHDENILLALDTLTNLIMSRKDNDSKVLEKVEQLHEDKALLHQEAVKLTRDVEYWRSEEIERRENIEELQKDRDYWRSVAEESLKTIEQKEAEASRLSRQTHGLQNVGTNESLNTKLNGNEELGELVRDLQSQVASLSLIVKGPSAQCGICAEDRSPKGWVSRDASHGKLPTTDSTFTSTAY